MGAPITSIKRGWLNKSDESETASALVRADLDFHIAEQSDTEVLLCFTYKEHRRFWAASVRLAEFPGNCGIVIMTGMYVDEDNRGKGLGDYLHRLAIQSAKKTGYTNMQCTTANDNAAQEHLLEKYGWMELYTFVNRRTGNTCKQWNLVLNHD